MGYFLTIGENKQVYCDENKRWISTATETMLDNAPAYGEPSDYKSTRWPSYSSWKNFTEAFGLYELFYGKNGLIEEHPGCVSLNTQHKTIIDIAYDKFKRNNPDITPWFVLYKNVEEEIKAYKMSEDDFYEKYKWREINGHFARLTWLKFWVDYALKNCKNPVFKNS